MIRTDGSVPFRFGKGGSEVLASCSLCDTEATLSFSAGPVCSCFSAEACANLQALCWSRQHQQVYHFSPFLILSLSLSFYSKSLWQELPSLSFTIRLQWIPGHLFLPGNYGADELANGERYWCPLQSFVVSLL